MAKTYFNGYATAKNPSAVFYEDSSGFGKL